MIIIIDDDNNNNNREQNFESRYFPVLMLTIYNAKSTSYSSSPFTTFYISIAHRK